MASTLTILFAGAPILLALGLGAIFTRRPLICGLVSVALFAGLLLVLKSGHGIAATLPSIALISGLAAVPAILAAHLGARLRLMLSKET